MKHLVEDALRENILFLLFKGGFHALKVERGGALSFDPKRWRDYEKSPSLFVEEPYKGYLVVKRAFMPSINSVLVCYLDGHLRKATSIEDLYASIYRRFPKFFEWRRKSFREVESSTYDDAYYLKKLPFFWQRDLAYYVQWGKVYVPEGELLYVETFFEEELQNLALLMPGKKELPRLLVPKLRMALVEDNPQKFSIKEQKLLKRFLEKKFSNFKEKAIWKQKKKNWRRAHCA